MRYTTCILSIGLVSLFTSFPEHRAILQREQLFSFSSNKPIQNSAATLERREGKIELDIDTRNLPKGAYTVWWVIFNDPNLCDEACGLEDLESGVGGTAVFFATGGLVKENGLGSFNAQAFERTLPKGFDQVLVSNESLENIFLADIILVIRHHGRAVPGLENIQTTQFNGGCDVNLCQNLQFTLFKGTKSMPSSSIE